MIKDIINLFFPKCCYACNIVLTDYEVGICTSCRHDLPVTLVCNRTREACSGLATCELADSSKNIYVKFTLR